MTIPKATPSKPKGQRNPLDPGAKGDRFKSDEEIYQSLITPPKPESPDLIDRMLKDLANQAREHGVWQVEHLVYELAKIGCSINEIAMVLHRDPRSLWPQYGEIFRRGYNLCKMKVRHTMYQKAVEQQDSKCLIYLHHNMVGGEKPKEWSPEDQTPEDPVKTTSTKLLLQVVETIKEQHAAGTNTPPITP